MLQYTLEQGIILLLYDDLHISWLIKLAIIGLCTGKGGGVPPHLKGALSLPHTMPYVLTGMAPMRAGWEEERPLQKTYPPPPPPLSRGDPCIYLCL